MFLFILVCNNNLLGVDLSSGKLHCLNSDSVKFVRNSKLQNTSNKFKVGDRVQLLVNIHYIDHDKKSKQLPWGTTGICRKIRGDKCKVKFKGLKKYKWVMKYCLERLDKNKAPQEDSSIGRGANPFSESIDEESIDPCELVKGDIIRFEIDGKKYMFLGHSPSGYQVDCVDLKSGELTRLYRNSVEFVGNSKLQNTSNEFKEEDSVRLLVNIHYIDHDKKSKQLPWGTTGTVKWLGLEECEVKFEESKRHQYVKNCYLEKLNKK
ncbi:MAG: hypothetical protein MHMPM18_004169 [Marteilia pararefringens]